MSVAPESLANLKPWTPGVSGNPGGRPQARTRVTTRFLNELADDYEVNGKAAIVSAREKDPLGYLKVIAGLLPKEIEITSPLDELTDEQLLGALNAIAAYIGAEAPPERTGATLEGEATPVLPAVSAPG